MCGFLFGVDSSSITRLDRVCMSGSSSTERLSVQPLVRPTAPHTVRLIGGAFRGRKLPVLDAPGLRPTPNRVRETLFNWLGQDLRGRRCIDAFAGTGALGFEAASRGAVAVAMVDRNPAVVARLRAACKALGAGQVQVQCGDAMAALQRCAAGSMDVVFLDPPFQEDVAMADLLRWAARAIGPHGCVYLESGQPWEPKALHPLRLHRHTRAGAVHAHLLVPGADGAASLVDGNAHVSATVCAHVGMEGRKNG